jgi:hypothetical protein
MMGGSRPDFSQPPPGYHAGMPPPTFRPSGSNMGPLPPRMPLPPTPMNGGGDRGWGTPPGGARGGPGIGAGGPSSSNGGGGGGGGGVPQGGQTTLFIGGISPGISDEILEQLLNVRRPSSCQLTGLAIVAVTDRRLSSSACCLARPAVSCEA